MTDRVAQVHGAHHGSVVAAAGCGKTHLVASVVAATQSPKPQLVLTHTHAGVDALRRKLAAVGGPGRADVETIAGWALRCTAAYPSLSGVPANAHKSKDWRPIYDGARRLAGKQAIVSMLSASYSGVLVDEYQDCTVEQHGLVLALAAALPCRVFGDPLQAIFDFDKNSRLVHWDNDVCPSFGVLSGEEIPWRWAKTDPALGQWLLSVRDALTAGSPISLDGSPVRHQRPETNLLQQVRSLAARSLGEGGTVTLIRNMKKQCVYAAGHLGAPWRCIDAVDDRDAIDAAAAIACATGADRAHAIVELSIEIASGATPGRDWVDSIRRGGTRIRTDRDRFDALLRTASESDIRFVEPALTALVLRPAVRVHRWQLYRDVLGALEVLARDGGTGEDAVWATRNSTRHQGRSVGRAAVGRTVLVKGLEFDHVIVLDAEQMNARNLYVALTRGAKRVTVISKSTTLTPKGK